MDNKTKSSIKHLIDVVRYSYNISIKSSALCTYLRITIVVLYSLLPIISLRISKNIINILTYNPNKNQLISLLIISTLITILGSLLNSINSYISIIHNEKMTYYITIIKYRKSIDIDMEYYDSSKYYDEYTNASKNSNSIQSVIWNIINLIGSAVRLISAIVVFSKYSILLTIIMIIASIPCGIIEVSHKKVMLDLQKKLIPYERKLGYAGSIFTNKQTIPDLKIYGCFDYLLNQFNALWIDRFNQVKRYNYSYITTSWVVSLLPQIIIFIVGLTIGLRVINTDMSIGDYSFYSGCALQLLNGIKTFINIYCQIRDNTSRVKLFIDFLNWSNRILDKGRQQLDVEKIHRIEILDLSFKYPETDKYILKNVNMSFMSNEKIALVGMNGAGKSTLVKLLLRLYEPDSGIIRIDGINIKEYSIRSLYDYFGIMFQDYNRYAFTLRENIALSDVKHIDDDELILKAIRNADAINVYQKLDNTLDAYLMRMFMEDGKELSGGEWQKVALARCFFKDSGIIILDEPSAALDAQAENELFTNVISECSHNNKGLVLITHRLSNVKIADKIFVINESVIAESGSHEELINKEGLYYNLYNMQAKKYQ